ncbi:DUF3592 domain-containing protein [Flavobacterium collinsii]|uniref:DUF3592 domain-containing protein n=1 Tax=Flavobacterium collinsii TaxID=1114861 RepID=UPI0037564F57
MNKRLIRAVIYVCFIPGLTLLVGAFYLFQQKLNFIEKANIVYGTVIESIPLAGNKNGSLYYPNVSFVTKSGKQIDFTSNVGTSLPSYIEGSSVKVLYDPTNPNKAEIDGIYGYIVDPMLLGGLGVFFLLMGLVAILYEYQKNRKTD